MTSCLAHADTRYQRQQLVLVVIGSLILLSYLCRQFSTETLLFATFLPTQTLSSPRWRNLKKRMFYSENASSVFTHSTLDKFKNATISGQFWFVFEENSVREITWLSWRHRFRRKATFSKCFPFAGKRKTSVSEFLWFDHEQHLRKLRFPETSVWTEGLTVEIKLRFQISLA